MYAAGVPLRIDKSQSAGQNRVATSVLETCLPRDLNRYPAFCCLGYLVDNWLRKSLDFRMWSAPLAYNVLLLVLRKQ